MPVFGFKAKPTGNDAFRHLQLYHACVWIQGKTMLYVAFTYAPLYHACVWIQGKTAQATTSATVPLYHACVWIQGKTQSRVYRLSK